MECDNFEEVSDEEMSVYTDNETKKDVVNDNLNVDHGVEDEVDNAYSVNDIPRHTNNCNGEESREFDILDEYVEKDDSDYSSTTSEYSDLEEDVETVQTYISGEKSENMLKERSVLKEPPSNQLEPLPPGWVKVIHESGMPLYLQDSTRVCTMSKPYFLGTGSARKHDVPVSAIPCLQYSRALKTSFSTDNGALQSCLESNESVQSASELLNLAINPQEVREYCQKRFRFKTIKVLRFESWSERRRFTKNKREQRQRNPVFPEGAKLIKFPIKDENNPQRKEWVLNLTSKSTVSILHEYVQHVLRKHPRYIFRELENAATPYSATVTINDMQYGVGYGTSKKLAKLNAAKASLQILCPELSNYDVDISTEGYEGNTSDFAIFDKLKIEDTRISEICNTATKPSPYATLLTCIQRNFGLNESDVKCTSEKNQFTMTVGEHTASVVCKNKLSGKQLASQAILQKLHPHISTWGALLRLYGTEPLKGAKEKNKEEQEKVQQQNKVIVTKTNFEILEALKKEMQRFNQPQFEMRKSKPQCGKNLSLPVTESPFET